MLIKEVADPVGTKLLALASFLKGRADDTGAKLEYPTAGFINRPIIAIHESTKPEKPAEKPRIEWR